MKILPKILCCIRVLAWLGIVGIVVNRCVQFHNQSNASKLCMCNTTIGCTYIDVVTQGCEKRLESEGWQKSSRDVGKLVDRNENRSISYGNEARKECCNRRIGKTYYNCVYAMQMDRINIQIQQIIHVKQFGVIVFSALAYSSLSFSLARTSISHSPTHIPQFNQSYLIPIHSQRCIGHRVDILKAKYSMQLMQVWLRMYTSHSYA